MSSLANFFSMSLEIKFRAIRNVDQEVQTWLTEMQETAKLLENLMSAIRSLESCKQDREILHITLQLMAADFSEIAAHMKETQVLDADIEAIRSLLHRTGDLVDGVSSVGVNLVQAAEKIVK